MKILGLSEIPWRKSSRSTNTGGACVEVAATWRKSRHSTDTGGACVEVAALASVIALRDFDSTKKHVSITGRMLPAAARLGAESVAGPACGVSA